jgi:uncharacterized protein (DUF302 family)
MFKHIILPALMSLAVSVGASMTAVAAPLETLEKSTDKSVEDAVDAFLSVLGRKGATVFAVVEHAKGAEKVGMEMKPATLVIFGNPKLGTPLMLESASIGIDLPMKALFHEGEDGKTHVLYTDIKTLAMRHSIDPDIPAVQNVAKALEGLTNAATK